MSEVHQEAIQQAFLAPIDFQKLKSNWANSAPFNHIVIDNFLDADIASAVVKEFPAYESESWRPYHNALEIKNWDKFGETTYKLFYYLNSREFISQLECLTDCRLYADFGLNGGGLHTHKRGGKSNAHLDYSIHPKLKLERRLNLLIYITPGWQEQWGAALGMWDKDKEKNAPGELKKSIAPMFNRALFFDTTQNSWHGLPEPIECPEHVTRNSLAVYYLSEPRPSAPERGKALFAPYKEQAEDPEILALIEKRASVDGAAGVYGDK